MFGPKTGPNATRGNLSKETETFLAGFLSEKGASKRAMEDILNNAGRGKFVTAAVPKKSKDVRAGSTAAAHGVAVPRVGQKAHSLPIMPGTSGRKLQDAIRRENPPGREAYNGQGIPRGRDNEAAKDELALQM
eukprot:CAMPEP_0197575336 /NCGR_PEP_ID=MMETSP1326-20131121/774_1 /TAXON_ID=1155430 /ORGANISM="Genus nov. species nov., Strain RCC2288" /LENGTH=132 /DNA_ID=CAMNT_0043138091 /DNA_START=52 /DNA_END=447 /DNA_ORIENTATION=+